MSLSIGLVGLPNVGKSTLFNALTNAGALAANYPFATIEPNTGIVPIPDVRLGKLSEMYGNAPIKPATVKFVDIAGLVAGAAQGEGLGNQFLSHIREVDAICHVVRAFENDDIQHVSNAISPADDIAVINTELVLADLQTVSKKLPVLDKESKANPKLKPQAELLKKIEETLQENIPLHLSTIMNKDHTVEEKAFIKSLQLLTTKPVLYAFNIDEADFVNAEKLATLGDTVAPAKSVFINAQYESELNGLDDSEKQEMLEMAGFSEPGLNKLITAAYEMLGLQSYLTAGDKEVRAWTVHAGSTAPQAAGVIHTDFERGFIAAQIVNYDDLISAGSLAAAKSAGKVRTEGKDYIMHEGDVVEFRFNV